MQLDLLNQNLVEERNGELLVSSITIAENIKSELKTWYGNQVDGWKLVKVYKIKYGLPNLKTIKNEPQPSDYSINENLFILTK